MLVATLTGITPAYAGNTRSLGKLARRLQDHPRLRGEHLINNYKTTFFLGSPPPTRGTLNSELKEIKKIGITPAYAGNTGSTYRQAKEVEDHPRLRGEHLDI